MSFNIIFAHLFIKDQTLWKHPQNVSLYIADVSVVLIKSCIIIFFTVFSSCEGRINAEREIKRFVRPFGKVINDVSSAINKAVFRPQKHYHYVRANSFAQLAVANGRIGHTTLAAALPHREALNRRIIVYYPPTGRIIRLKVKDIGPWNTRDQYWAENRKPQAEVEEANAIGLPIEPSNRAGISLTPQAWYKLGVRRNIAFSGNFTGIVGWRFINSDRPPPNGNLPHTRATDFRFR